jgi:phosphoribosyl 1,2-cyclic phosphodiesterase
MNVCVLASGSSGNCTWIGSGGRGLLVDAGASARQVEARLKDMSLTLSSVAGICVTHEHGDHVAGLRTLHQRHGVPLFANAGTIEVVDRANPAGTLAWNVFETGQPFRVADFDVTPFAVPHDCCEPVGFVIGDGRTRTGIVTDMGVATHLVRERLRGCDVLVLEANHDEDLLRNADRPWSLKQRIAGPQGHLSNRQAGELAAELAGPNTRCVFLAHLSADCNDPALARVTVRRILDARGLAGVAVELTYPDKPSRLVEC